MLVEVLQRTLVHDRYRRKRPEPINVRLHGMGIGRPKCIEAREPMAYSSVAKLFSGFEEDHPKGGAKGDSEALEVNQMPQAVDRRASGSIQFGDEARV